MQKLKYGIPNPPSRAAGHHAFMQDGTQVCYAWIMDEEGARIIENQFVSAQEIKKELSCSQATAYRVISRFKKRYWVADLRDEKKPRCYSALPRRLLASVEIQPVGNPGWRSGIYQQGMRLRRK